MSSPRIYKAEGIILKRRNVGETDRILTVVTKEYGKIRVLAKGIRRVSSRRSPHVEVFTCVHLLIHRGKTLDVVSEVAPLATFSSIRGDLGRLSVAYFYCELVDTLIAERQEHRQVYRLLLEALQWLNDAPARSIYGRTKQFALALLWDLGFLPRDKNLVGHELQSFIENITEKHLHTPRFVRQILSS